MEGRRRNRQIIVYAETKHPSWHRQRGMDFVNAIAQTLAAVGPLAPYAALWTQSFEWDVLDQLKRRLGLPAFALVGRDAALNVDELSGRFDGVGIAKQRIDPRTEQGLRTLAQLRAAKLQIHAWTFRYDLPGERWVDAEAELGAYMALGLEGLFCDFPGRARHLRDRLG